MSFEAKAGFEGGVVTPEDAGVDEFETDADVDDIEFGRVTVYDPTEGFT